MLNRAHGRQPKPVARAANLAVVFLKLHSSRTARSTNSLNLELSFASLAYAMDTMIQRITNNAVESIRSSRPSPM